MYKKIYLEALPIGFGGYLIFDDTVLKSCSHQIAMVSRQYSGNVGGIIEGIGVVVMLYYLPAEDSFYLLGYRILGIELLIYDKY